MTPERRRQGKDQIVKRGLSIGEMSAGRLPIMLWFRNQDDRV